MISLLAQKYATEKKVMSAATTPTSIKKACFMPFEILVSRRIKNSGPKENDNRIPSGTAGKNSSIF